MTKEEIIQRMVDKMPFDLERRIVPYISEAMTIYAESKAKEVMVYNTEYYEDDPQDMPEYICLYDIRGCNEFEILASTEFLT